MTVLRHGKHGQSAASQVHSRPLPVQFWPWLRLQAVQLRSLYVLTRFCRASAWIDADPPTWEWPAKPTNEGKFACSKPETSCSFAPSPSTT